MSDFSDAIGQIYIENRRRLRRFLASRLARDADADDALQEVFIRVLSLGGGREVSSPLGLIYKVAANFAVDLARGDRVRAAVIVAGDEDLARLPANDPDPETTASQRQRHRRLEQAIDELPPRCREVFVLHRFEEMTYPEIAARLGISRNMVEKHIIRALCHLRARMAAAEEGG
ncbi:MAG: RNA polymerase sigma factor [Solirubrobacterales bacterium]